MNMDCERFNIVSARNGPLIVRGSVQRLTGEGLVQRGLHHLLFAAAIISQHVSRVYPSWLSGRRSIRPANRLPWGLAGATAIRRKALCALKLLAVTCFALGVGAWSSPAAGQTWCDQTFEYDCAEAGCLIDAVFGDGAAEDCGCIQRDGGFICPAGWIPSEVVTGIWGYDTDGDGIADREDDCPSGASTGTDTDGDGCFDSEDSDDDNDGTPDSEDDLPTDPSEDTDTDGDGTGDNADTDDDGDGVGDSSDLCPRGASGGPDTDGDGCADSEDAFPNDATEGHDSDGDGIGDKKDRCRRGASSGTDTDADGCTDSEDWDDDGDGVVDVEDICPLNENENCGGTCAFRPVGRTGPMACGFNLPPSDSTCPPGWKRNNRRPGGEDGIYCICYQNVSLEGGAYGHCVQPPSSDTDGDGVDDDDDQCPNGGTGADTDGDGCTNAEDPDDDNDGILDVEDVCQSDADETCGGVCAFSPGGTAKVGMCASLCEGDTCPATCPGGWQHRGEFCLCPDGKSVNSAGECVCPEGSEEFDGSCQVPVECRSDQVSTESNTCECPAGEEEFPGPPEFCAVPAVCEAGTERDSNQNTCACPSGGAPTDISMRDGKGSCNICADAESSTPLSDNCICEAQGESPTGTWGDEHDPPRCCTSLAHAPPMPESPPPVQRVPQVRNLRGQSLWGATSINPPVANLQCVCVSSGKYRIEGDISIGAGSKVEASTGVHPPRGVVCLSSIRTPSNIGRTTVHEQKHADKIVGVINDLKDRWIGQEYASETRCEDVIKDLVGMQSNQEDGKVHLAYENEVGRQNAHLDHAGEVRYYSECSGTPRTMREGRCNHSICGHAWKY